MRCGFAVDAKLYFGKHIGLSLLIILIYAPFILVHAQTVDITQLAFPSSIRAGSLEPTAVSVAIPYADVKPGFWFIVGIVDLKLNNTIVPGTAEGSPLPCLNQAVAEALCQTQLQSESGTENVQFMIGGIFANTRYSPGTWDLQIKVEILDSNQTVLSRSAKSFEIDLAPSLLSIDVPNNATYWVDGIASTGGVVPVALGPHSVAVPMFVTINDTNRLRFESWADGVTQPNRTVIVPSDVDLNVVYRNQYRLSINTNVAGASVAGAGWYDDGSLASFSETGSLSTGGVLDLLGAKAIFQGWFENGKLITSDPSGSIEMNRPHTISAEWTIDYSIPLIFCGVVFTLGFGAYLIVRRKPRKSRKKQTGARRSRVKRTRSKED